MNKIKQLAPIALIILILGIVGRMDYEDQVQLERYKCECNQGTWITENNGNTQYCK